MHVENDFIWTKTQKDTLTSNEFIESDYVKNMRTSLLFSDTKGKSEETHNQKADFIFNTCQDINSSALDIGMNIENTVVKHKVPLSSLTRHKFHKSISFDKAREFFIKFGDANRAKYQHMNYLTARNDFTSKTISTTVYNIFAYYSAVFISVLIYLQIEQQYLRIWATVLMISRI